jgi:hypothetical protein
MAMVVDYVGSPKIDGQQVAIKENCLFLCKTFEFEGKDIDNESAKKALV